MFFGVLIQLPAAFCLAFGQRNRTLAGAVLVLLGMGSATILDEIIYLVMTKATDGDYVSAVSLTGAVAFISLATLLLLALYRLHRDQA